MTFWMVFAACLVGSFLLGGMPFGLWVGKLHRLDVRAIGSGNVGAMNVGRILGRKWFFVVFLLDLLKGLFPTIIGGIAILSFSDAGPGDTLVMICRLLVGLASILGHNYSPLLGFKGGKGVSTSLGVTLGIFPDFTYPGLLSFGMWVLGFGLTRMSSVGSLAGGVSFPVFYILLLFRRGGSTGENLPFVVFALLVALMVVVRHRSNITRILAGTETRVGRPKAVNERR